MDNILWIDIPVNICLYIHYYKAPPLPITHIAAEVSHNLEYVSKLLDKVFKFVDSIDSKIIYEKICGLEVLLRLVKLI